MSRLTRPVEPDFVNFSLAKTRVGHAVSKIAVVGQQNQARAILVKAADWLEVMQIVRQ
jgi:hypothetical protein